jgi:hypothetical protein
VTFLGGVVLGFELRASYLLGRCFYSLNHSASPFLGWVFFEIGSGELFARADFEL